MKTSKLTYKNLLLAISLTFITGAPLAAQADRGQYARHAYHFDRHDQVYTQPRHQYKHLDYHKHSWKHRHNKSHHIYNQHRGYYKNHRRNYNRHHPNTRHNYGRNYSYNYYAAPYYAPPAQVVFGLNTANTQILLRY